MPEGNTPLNTEESQDFYLPPLDELDKFKEEHPELYQFIVKNATEKLRLKAIEKEHQLERAQKAWEAKTELANREMGILERQSEMDVKQALISSYTTAFSIFGLFILLGISILYGDTKQTLAVAGLLGGLIALAKLYSPRSK